VRKPASLAVVWVAVAVSGAVAVAEPLPGLLDKAEVEEAEQGATAQKRDAQAAIRRNARLLGYTREQIDKALQPTMELSGTFVHKLEDGTEIEFPWFRTGFAENRLANTSKPIARGPDGAPLRSETNKGGIRVEKGVFADEVYALALKMDSKLGTSGDAFDGMSVRGAKGGIGAGKVLKVGSRYKAKVGDYVDPASPAVDRPQLMRRLADDFRAAGGDVGPGLDIQAGDVNTKAAEMKALAEAYGSPEHPSSGVSGKAVRRRPDGSVDPDGGIEYRAVSTGEGVWMTARLAARRAGLKLRGATVVAQGWGEVGRAFGMAAVKDGARVIAIQNLWKVDGKQVAGTLVHPLGASAKPIQVKAWLADVDALIASGQDIGSFEGGRMASQLQPGVDASDLRADIVGLNALGNVLTEKTVPRYVSSGTHAGRRKVLVEGANLAESEGGAEKIDRAKDALLVVAGDLANLGGVHVSNLEGVQNLYQREVSSDSARRSLQRTMRSGWSRAMKIADQRGLSERAAIELAAVDAMMKRSLQMADAPRNSLEQRVMPRSARRSTRLASRVRPGARLPTRSRAAIVRHLRTTTRRSGRTGATAALNARSKLSPKPARALRPASPRGTKAVRR
jgi:glutamate dehydrogenase/leucine dehydrogenase